MDLFTQSPSAVGLVGVGCCYHIVTSLLGERKAHHHDNIQYRI